ncbi:MAG: AAA family ATPase [Fusobacteriaceae bacterium]
MKSVIAFCYYFASTHNFINIESDYKKVFFIIDDPISSMDYTYTYTLAQILKNIEIYFEKIEKRHKIILLTHNFEFASLLARNNIFDNLYHLSMNFDCNHILKKIEKQFIYPYKDHLLSIYRISRGTESPIHTTGNSIRYVLESLMRFCAPKLENLGKFIAEDSILSKNGVIYGLVNDLSHGNIGGELSLVSTIDKNLIEASKTVIEYIEEKFPKKLDGIDENTL